MPRQDNTDVNGNQFTEEIKKEVWNKTIPHGFAIDEQPDKCGKIIKLSEYGNRKSEYGWEIDHINPHGTDDLTNLQALHWKNNVDKSDQYPWDCPNNS